MQNVGRQTKNLVTTLFFGKKTVDAAHDAEEGIIGNGVATPPTYGPPHLGWEDGVRFSLPLSATCTFPLFPRLLCPPLSCQGTNFERLYLGG